MQPSLKRELAFSVCLNLALLTLSWIPTATKIGAMNVVLQGRKRYRCRHAPSLSKTMSQHC
ncbi:hypothetical protein BD410DRAFT_793027 [Rickenella mellea]|uniref:Uncharacterized protein n=1 Tax=Rickenella mellea TaxID=50990 RepID=A0A4Y7PU18_9AGAM|nr:hypothetical protein BD410DRAFT_793027 [Rickenella mellea]